MESYIDDLAIPAEQRRIPLTFSILPRRPITLGRE
jgi:hypothetical protein